MPLLPSILKNRPASAEPPAVVNTENSGAKNASAQQQISNSSTKNGTDEQKQQNEPFDAVKKISEEFDRKRAEFFADFSTNGKNQPSLNSKSCSNLSDTKELLETTRTMASTYNHSSSYNRSYERKVVEEGGGGGGGGTPAVHFITTSSSSPLHTIRSTMDPIGGGGAFGSSGFGPYNYKFGSSTSGTYHSSDDSFSATLDVSAFAPEELKVSVIGAQIVIEGKHPEKQDSLGTIERQFIRKFAMPRNCHPDTVSSSVTNDGQLTVTAHAPKIKDNSPARSIPIKVVNAGAAGSSSGAQPTNGI